MITKKEKLFDAFVVKRRWPKNIKTSDRKYFQHEIERAFPEVNFITFKNVNVSAEGIVFDLFSTAVSSLPHPAFASDYGMKYRFVNLLKRKRTVLLKDQKYLLVSNPWSINYFHWLLDALPRLISVKEQCKDLILLLPENHKSKFIETTLSKVNLKGIEYLPMKSYAHVGTLLMPEHSASTGNFYPPLTKQVRDYLLQFADFSGIGNPEAYEKIYVSRKKAKSRYVSNEDEVIEVLVSNGFRVICFEDLSFPEEIAIMCSCKYFAGIHGANLVNMMFMPENGKVLQFAQAGNSNDNCYLSLASIFNLDFYNQFCDYTLVPSTNSWDMNIGLDDLKNNLKAMLSQ